MAEHDDVFLSYSRNDGQSAALVHTQLERAGLSVFKDDERIREGDLWLERLQLALDGCGAFVVLVGRDGVRRWVGAETQVALSRYFGPHDDAKRLPIFPILLPGTEPDALPAFLRLFQTTGWNAAEPLPDRLVDSIRSGTIGLDEKPSFEGCPFVGLAAYRVDQAHLFFGRQKETLDALACFFEIRPGRSPVRWLEINGNSGSGKSSLMQAGLLPLVDRGWMWQPRGGYEHWRCIGPMVPGERPLRMLAESLARAFNKEMTDVRRLLERDEGRALAEWLRSRKEDGTAFLLAIDQFEELFTFAEEDERRMFDRLLAGALEDRDCPLFVISTVRSDFLDRFAEDLPRLVAVRNRSGRPWTLAPISADGLREVIAGPARLSGLDVGEVKEVMVAEARDEPGALPLVENALYYLWEQRGADNRLSGRLLTDQGGLAGILSRSADALLDGLDKPQRDRALELLFRLVRVDPEGRRHARRRIPLEEALAVAGGGERGRTLIDHLAGRRSRDGGLAQGPLRLITVTEDAGVGAPAGDRRSWVNLIHETLIRRKGPDAEGRRQPYWPTLWNHIERNKERAARRERLRLMAREWQPRTGLSRLFGLAGWSSLFGFRGLAALGSVEQRFLRWSRGRALVQAAVLAAVLGVVGESVYWAQAHGQPLEAIGTRWAYKLGRPLAIPELVRVPPDDVELPQTFRMGGKFEDEQPVHPVTFARPFYLGATEVTFAQYDAFCEDTGCHPSDEGWPEREKRPVINVDWNDARAYATWFGAITGNDCRLPSEAEWEYAARAGTTTKYGLPGPEGSHDIAGEGLANCANCGSQWDDEQTAPVRSFEPNGWDLYDMHGNVWEWVEDCWHGSYEGAPDDGTAWLEEGGGVCSSRVLRGGSWLNGQDYARSAYRFGGAPYNRHGSIGFRVVCSSPSSGH